MIELPQIDGRKEEDILLEIYKKSKLYTPEWKFNREEMDGGAVLVKLFAQMFEETIDRFDQVPYKYYLEFLNLLGVGSDDINAATGTIKFNMVGNLDENVFIPAGTQIYYEETTEDENTDGRVLFETQTDFVATPSSLRNIFSVDPKKDIIERVDKNEWINFFNPNAKNNIQSHFFAIAAEDVLFFSGKMDVTLKIKNTKLMYLNKEINEVLANKDLVTWFFYDENREEVVFEEVYLKQDEIHLIKNNYKEISQVNLNDKPSNTLEDKIPLESGNIDSSGINARWIVCRFKSDSIQQEELISDSLFIGSSSIVNEKQAELSLDLAYANDSTIDIKEGGYCFGKQLMPYDCFYMASSEVFSKRGATIHIKLDLGIVPKEIGVEDLGIQYDFAKKYIIEKKPEDIRRREEITVSNVVWEYWNGLGWTALPIKGLTNPFNGTFQGDIEFVCPKDFQPSMQNAIENYWIRVRILDIQNEFSTYANMMLPIVKRISLDFDYGNELREAEIVFTENNCNKKVYYPKGENQVLTLYKTLQETEHAMYMNFDAKPNGYPVNLYFDVEGNTYDDRVIIFQYLGQDIEKKYAWRDIKVIDQTNALTNSGIVSLYIPSDFKEMNLFGEEGYWLRIISKDLKYKHQESLPVVKGIYMNAVNITQKETIGEVYFASAIHEANKKIILPRGPVLEAEVWINEIAEISKFEMNQLLKEQPDQVAIEYDGAQNISEFWVRWNPIDSIEEAKSNDRVYVLSHYENSITFGDDHKGKVVPYNENANIKVQYSCGGGKRGNLEKQREPNLVTSISYVSSIENIQPTCGGSDKHDMAILEKIGSYKLKSRNRAVTKEDFENIILEKFAVIKDVKCFSNFDQDGNIKYGNVTIVIRPDNVENRTYCLLLCQEVYEYLKGVTSCELIESGRLHIIPAVIIQINAEVKVKVEDYEYAASLEKEIINILDKYFNNGAGTGSRKIGETVNRGELFDLINQVKYVSYVEEISLEGIYYEGNVRKMIPLNEKTNLKYNVMVSGKHIVKM